VEKTTQVLGKGTAWLTTGFIGLSGFGLCLMAHKYYVAFGMAIIGVFSAYMLGRPEEKK